MRPLRFPAGLAPALEVLALVLLYVLDLAVSWDFSTAPGWLDVRAVPLLGLAVYVPLLWRRRRPLLVLALSVLASIGFSLLVPHTVLMLGPFLALYSAARHTRLRPAYAGLGMALVLVAANVLAQLDFVAPEEAGQLVLVSGLLGTMMAVAAFAAGRWGRSAARQRRIQAQLAAADERSRIARELHDVVAHSVSLMVLQAAGAGRLLQSDPDRARTALRHVDELGGQAIAELRRMLGLLVPSDPLGPEGTAGRLEELPGLVQELRAAGREVVLSVEGEPAALPADAGTAAFRVAQEALTNAAKYADPQRPVEVRLTWRDGGLGLLVRSHGSRGAGRPAGTGHGIGGMRQRAESVGGRLEAGTTPEGGFLVSASFPAAGRTKPGQAKPGRIRRPRWRPRTARAAGGGS